MWILRIGECFLSRIIGRYYNYLDMMADIKAEGLESWKSRNVPEAWSLPEIPDGWMTTDEAEFQYFISEKEAEELILKCGGGRFRMGGYEVLAADPNHVEAVAVRRYARRRYNDGADDTRISMNEASEWSGINRRTLDRHVKRMNINTELLFCCGRRYRMIEPADVVKIAFSLCQCRPEYYIKKLNSFLKEVGNPCFDPSDVKEKIRSKATSCSSD